MLDAEISYMQPSHQLLLIFCFVTKMLLYYTGYYHKFVPGRLDGNKSFWHWLATLILSPASKSLLESANCTSPVKLPEVLNSTYVASYKSKGGFEYSSLIA